MLNCNSTACRYTVFGVLFGCCFPVIAISFDILYQVGLGLTWSSVNAVHRFNPLHYIIDTAPLFLGFAFGLAGRIQGRVNRLNDALKINAEELKVKNTTLGKALEDLQSTQRQLIIKEKMSAVGQLTAGIAHEINNPINFVSSNVSPLKKDVEDVLHALNSFNSLSGEEVDKVKQEVKAMDLEYTVKEIHELLDGIEEGARRTAEIVRGLKNFSHSDDIGVRDADINESIRTTLILIKHKIHRRIKVECELGSVPLVKCRHGEINQVFMNILSNAADAIAGEGLITVKTYAEGANVFIRITDTGKGMNEETQRRIFEPFFTTKDVGEGTGLGLNITFKIIQNHGGDIDVQSKVGHGSSFTIRLPIIHEQ
jgi:signal transduction histidine kinase